MRKICGLGVFLFPLGLLAQGLAGSLEERVAEMDRGRAGWR
jgi:hypothetical protein